MNEYEYQLKFVVSAAEDLQEICSILHNTSASRNRVLLMAEGTDAQTIRARAPWILEICRREGFRYSPRLQVDLSVR